MNGSTLSELIRDPNLEKLELILRRPNFFSILRVEDKEIRHSNFLAWLLDPNEGHNLSTTFLRWFLKDIFADQKIKEMSEFTVDDLELSNVRVLREWGNIDILIEHSDFIVCVENKLYSGEHSNQLKKYREIIQREYPNKKKAYVFLSPYDLQPENEADANEYVIYSYEDIKRNLETILSVYGDSLPPKVKYYINDYNEVILEDIMKEGEAIEIARNIYKNHTEAIDFIIKNKPDRLMEVASIFDEAVEKHGYVLCSPGKGYARFLTPALNKVIPRNGVEGWRNRESFLFEIDYWNKQIKFQTVVSPGDTKTRKLLSDVLSLLPGSKTPQGNKWLIHFKNVKKIDVTDDEYRDESKLVSEIDSLLTSNKEKIQFVEDKLLKAFA